VFNDTVRTVIYVSRSSPRSSDSGS
jgi:hypothetical protein